MFPSAVTRGSTRSANLSNRSKGGLSRARKVSGIRTGVRAFSTASGGKPTIRDYWMKYVEGNGAVVDPFSLDPMNFPGISTKAAEFLVVLRDTAPSYKDNPTGEQSVKALLRDVVNKGSVSSDLITAENFPGVSAKGLEALKASNVAKELHETFNNIAISPSTQEALDLQTALKKSLNAGGMIHPEFFPTDLDVKPEYAAEIANAIIAAVTPLASKNAAYTPVLERYQQLAGAVNASFSGDPIRVAVTGASGQIGYALLFRIASGQMFPGRRVILQLLELPQAMSALEGVAMELRDCAFPALQDIVITDKPEEAFNLADWALLVGAQPRGKGMERGDLLQKNAAIFTAQGKALNTAARGKDTRVVVVGNPANTNAMIAQQNAPNIPAANFSAMMQLDHNRALAQLAAKTGASVSDFDRFAVWGNHSATQFPDISHATVRLDGARKDVVDVVDQAWVEKDFIPTVQQRGAAIISARGASSAASAASALVDHVRDLYVGTSGRWTSLAVCSNGEYGVDPGLFYSYPVVTKMGAWDVVKDLPISKFAAERMEATRAELAAERDAIKDLLPSGKK